MSLCCITERICRVAFSSSLMISPDNDDLSTNLVKLKPAKNSGRIAVGPPPPPSASSSSSVSSSALPLASALSSKTLYSRLRMSNLTPYPCKVVLVAVSPVKPTTPSCPAPMSTPASSKSTAPMLRTTKGTLLTESNL